jgi:presenilin-like A22 family membrane protease
MKKFKESAILKSFLWEGLFSFFIFSVALFTAQGVYKLIKEKEILVPKLTLNDFLILFFLATLFILILIFLPKFKKMKGYIFKFAFFFSGAYGTLIVFSLFCSKFFSNFLFINLLPLFLTSAFIYWRAKFPSLLSHNLFISFGLAGIAPILGLSFKPEILLIILGALSVYDFIAVYKTKHMIKMAKSMIESGVVMGLIIPRKIEEFLVRVKEVQPGGRFIILGGGDIAFPLIFSISLIPYSLFDSMIVSIFSIGGILFSLFLFLCQKERKPIPALPPIVLFSIIGYLLTLFI